MSINKKIQQEFVMDCANNTYPESFNRFKKAMAEKNQALAADILESWYDLLKNPKKVVGIFDADPKNADPDDKMSPDDLRFFLDNAVRQFNSCLHSIVGAGQAVQPKLANVLREMNSSHIKTMNFFANRNLFDAERKEGLRLDLIFGQPQAGAASTAAKPGPFSGFISAVKTALNKVYGFFFGQLRSAQGEAQTAAAPQQSALSRAIFGSSSAKPKAPVAPAISADVQVRQRADSTASVSSQASNSEPLSGVSSQSAVSVTPMRQAMQDAAKSPKPGPSPSLE
ncbi:MAG: hypothetical protein K0S29_124 [Gammaproteobacteria bacterium]|jgi:hypothetical protein|nr:hypothetical protein [Gammaproteobacteria bacterium]